MTNDGQDWLHGNLSRDDEFRGRWAAYLAERLRDGMTVDDAVFVARRLQQIAVKRCAETSVSLNAASDLCMLGVVLERKALRFETAFHARMPQGIDLHQLVSAMLLGHDRRQMYLDVRRTAFKKLEQCRSDEVDGWPALFGSWTDFVIAERVVYRWWPAEQHGTARRHDEVGRIFDEDEYRTLSKEDSELEEAFADIFTAMTLYSTDESQEDLRRELLAIRASHGRFQARARLREMRQEFLVAPWNYARWDSELRLEPRTSAEAAAVPSSAEPAPARGTEPEPPAGSESEPVFLRWMEAKRFRRTAELTSLLDELLAWGRNGSPMVRALAFSEASAVIAEADLGTGYRVALAASDAIDATLTSLPDAGSQTALHSMLAPAINNVLEVLLALSKLEGDHVDRGAYAWVRRMQGAPDLSSELRKLDLMRLVAHYEDASDPAAVWRFRQSGYDHRFLVFSDEAAAGWRFMFEPDGSVAMDPFELSTRDVAVIQAPTGRTRTPAERDALRQALFGPWVGLRLDVGQPFEEAILLRRAEELADLDLTWLRDSAGGRDPGWPALAWFDHLDQVPSG